MRKQSGEEPGAQFMSWFNKRVHRSTQRILDVFGEEFENDLQGLDRNTVQSLHSIALFEALRVVNTPLCMRPNCPELTEAEHREFVAFLQEKLAEHYVLADEIENWQPASLLEKAATSESDLGLAAAIAN